VAGVTQASATGGGGGWKSGPTLMQPAASSIAAAAGPIEMRIRCMNGEPNDGADARLGAFLRTVERRPSGRAGSRAGDAPAAGRCET